MLGKYQNCVKVPSSSPLGFCGGYVFIFAVFFPKPAVKLFEVLQKPLWVGHILGISQSDPACLFDIVGGDIGIDYISTISQALSDKMLALCSVFGVFVFLCFSRLQIEVVVFIELLNSYSVFT